MNTQITLSLLMLVALISCTDNKAQKKKAATDFDPEKITVEIEVMEFEPTPEGDPAFYSVSDIRVDNESNMYLFDPQLMKIKVFNSKGEQLAEFGKEGKGPGEYERPRSFYLNKKNGDLMIFDRNAARLTRFTKQGEVKELIPTEVIKVMPKFLRDGDRNIVINPSFDSDTLAMITDDSFNPISEFLSTSEYGEGLEKIQRAINISSGSALAYNDHFYFAPVVYSGEIYDYVFDPGLNNYVLDRKIVSTPVDQPFEVLSNNSKRQASVRFFSPEGELSVLFLSGSNGLYKYEDDIFHFVGREEGNKRIFGVELFDEQWKYIGFKEIRSIELDINDEDAPQRISFVIEDIDRNGIFYGRQRNEYGDWQVFKLNIDTSNM